MGDRLVVARTAERGGQSLLTGFIFEKTLRKHSLSLWGLHWSTFLQAMEGGSFRNIRRGSQKQSLPPSRLVCSICGSGEGEGLSHLLSISLFLWLGGSISSPQMVSRD